MLSRTFIFLLILLTSCSAAPQFAIESELQTDRPLSDLISFLDTYIPEQMEQNNVPGLSIALIRDGDIVWVEYYGVTNSLTREPVTESTIFEAASLGKPVAAYGVLQLVSNGKIQLDDKLDDYLSEPFLSDPQNQISLQHVLSHSSGLSNNMRGFDTQVYFPPGQEFRYSGMGYLFAQAAVESISGTSFDQYMQESVFKTLGMNDSSYQWQEEWADRVSSGHVTGLNFFGLLGTIFLVIWLIGLLLFLIGRALVRKGIPWLKTIGTALIILIIGAGLMALFAYNLSLPLPIGWSQNRSANAASSLYANTEDLAVFMQQLLDPEKQTAIEQQMLEPQIQVDQNLYWGNGIGIQENSQGRKSFWQWGSNIDFQGFMIGYPEEQLGVVILTNSSNGLSIVPGIVQHAVGGEQYWWQMLNE